MKIINKYNNVVKPEAAFYGIVYGQNTKETLNRFIETMAVLFGVLIKKDVFTKEELQKILDSNNTLFSTNYTAVDDD